MAQQPRGRSGRHEQAFDAPPSDRSSQSADTGTTEFESPPGGSEDAGSSSQEASFASYEVDADLQNMKEELERQIFSRPTGMAAGAKASDIGPPETADLIVGVGIGPAHRDFESVGPAGPGAPVLNVYVSEKLDADQVKGVVVDSFGARALSS